MRFFGEEKRETMEKELEQNKSNDSISRQAAIDGFYEMTSDTNHLCTVGDYVSFLESLSAQPEIIRCKDCRHNHNCDIQYHAQAGDMFFCAGAERRTE